VGLYKGVDKHVPLLLAQRHFDSSIRIEYQSTMASLFDFLSLLVTAAFFVGIIIAVIYAVQQIKLAVNNTKESLKKRGLHVTESGVSVKTDKHFDREDYVDATQRGILKAMGSASFGKVDDKGNHIAPSPSASRHPSSSKNSSTNTPDEKNSRLGLRRGNSGMK